MATLDQLYRAYLQDDPNVSQMTYDPFGWNYEQTFDTTEEGTDTDTDTGIEAVVSPTTTGGDNYSVYNPDPNKIRLPSSFQRTEGSWRGPGTVGLPGDILQRGPGREFTGMEADIVGDPRKLDDEDASWFKQLQEGLRDNPLMRGVMAVANPAMNFIHGLAQTLPVNERAILENQALGSGVALDDIGRVVQQQGLDYDTAENVMAGYNYAQMDEDTFDNRIKNLKMKEGPAKEARIKAIKAAKQAWLESKRKTNIIAQKQRLDRADDDQKATIKEFKTRDVLQDDPSLHTFTAPKDKVIVPPAKPKRTTTIQDTGRDDRPSTPSFDPGGGFVDQGGQGEFGGGGGGDVWIADGGMVKDAPRKPYGKGGIVDLLQVL